ncbi:hypothetical protein DM01DRAFT_1386430 [Hesseltinella vesiculosa]|uniref:F-box domain-containing protein n=1 Tax=Hesseltinella vesiculosa TaxID=101127 RepID=A0A1X2G5W8_9FUNG|nr:hypothetical protein DM01DRAFT_1386430 [Hesseltinella vesiculosa]
MANITDYPVRHWQGGDGVFEVEASFVSIFQKQKIKLRKLNGAIIAIPMDRLSKEDLTYVQQCIGTTLPTPAQTPQPEQPVPTQPQAQPPTPTPTASQPPTPQSFVNVHQQQHLPAIDTHLPTSYINLATASASAILSPAVTYTQVRPPPTLSHSTPHRSSPTASAHAIPHPDPQRQSVYMNPHSRPPPAYRPALQPSLPSYSSSYQPTQPHPSPSANTNPNRRSPTGAQPPTMNGVWSQLPPSHPATRSSTIVMRSAVPTSRPNKIHSLTQLPNTIISRIGHWLDVRSRHQLARTCRRVHALVMRRDVWFYLDFNVDDWELIKDEQFQKLCGKLRQFQLGSAVRHVVLDGTLVSAISVVSVFSTFPSIKSLSIRHCPLMDHQQLGKLLSGLAGGTHLRELISFRMVNNKSNKRIHGDDVQQIHRCLERLADQPVEIDCHVCDQCHINACTATLQCIHCGPVPVKRCTACAPVCDHCHGRTCGGMQCQVQPSIMLAWYECGRQCQIQPLVLCSQPSCNALTLSRPALPGQRRYAECPTHGLVHARCRVKANKFVSNLCSGCDSVVCPFCDLQKCGGGCNKQWCYNCMPRMDVRHCKCILIRGAGAGGAITSKTKMSKRSVCGPCQLTCGNCNDGTFCQRCLPLHQEECKPKNKKLSKKKKTKKK